MIGEVTYNHLENEQYEHGMKTVHERVAENKWFIKKCIIL